jgi:dienelactone hydrolase
VRRFFDSLLLVLVFATAASAQAPPESDTQRLLMEGDTPAGLRALLFAKAAKLEASDRASAGELLYYAGMSYERGAEADSAIATYRRAVELRGAIEERIALADALLTRRRGEDVEHALDALEQRPPGLQPSSSELQARLDASRAWGRHLAGRSEQARDLFQPHASMLSLMPDWRYRMAVVDLALGDARHAYQLLFPLAVTSYKQDREVMARLREITDAMNATPRLEGEIDRAIQKREQGEALALERMKATRYRFTADDAFPLSGSVIAPEGKTRRMAAVVLVAPGDTIADYDSLAVALERSGYAMMLLDVRGSGGSVGPTCPLPDRWVGREQALQTLCARDVRVAFKALARLTPVDTTHYAVVGVGTAASIAVEAAGLDRRIAALLLVSPRPAAVDRGPMRARLARLRVPVYFQSGPEDFDWFVVTERLYQSGNRSASRVAEARLVGHGVRQFYYDPAIANRFTRWLDETMRTTMPRAPRPTSPRKG